LGYVKVSELTEKNFRSEVIKVPFAISGKVILDVVSLAPSLSSFLNISSSIGNASSSLIKTINLVPGFPSTVNLMVRNLGSATAHGTVVNVAGLTAASVSGTTVLTTTPTNVTTGVAAQPSSSSTVILGSKVFNIGTISPEGSKRITLVIYPSVAAAGTVQTLNIAISYDDAYGNRKTVSPQLVGLQILPLSPQPGLSVSPSPSPSPSSLTHPSSSSSYSVLSSSPLSTPSSNTTNSGTTNTNIDTQPTYSSYAAKSLSQNSSTIPSPSNNTTSSLIQIRAGKIQDIRFTITSNNATFGSHLFNIPNIVTNVAVSLASQSNLVKILGTSNWNLANISSGSKQELTTQVYAYPSLIGNPVIFTVTLRYIQNGDQLKTASFNLGGVVVR
jgi:hypothetical protein